MRRGHFRLPERTRARRALLLIAASSLITPSLEGALPKTWTNATGNDSWFNTSNWDPTAFPTQSDDLTFPAAFPGGRSAVKILSGIGEARSLAFQNGYTLSGSLVSATGNIDVSPGITATVTAELNGNQGLRKLGSGTLVLNPSVAHPFTGTVNVLVGTLDIGFDSNLGNVSNAVSLAGALRTRNTFSSARTISLNSVAATFEPVAGTTFTLTGLIDANGALVKAGGGTLVLTGANTYNGGTVVNAGTLSIDADARLGNLTSPITFNGGTLATTANFFTNRQTTLNAAGGTANVATGTTFTVQHSAAIADSGRIGGTGTLTKTGGGTLNMQASHTYSGGTAINGGTLLIQVDSHLGAANAPISFDGGTLATTSTITTARPVTLNSGGGTIDVGIGFDRLFQFSNVFSGPGALTKSGAGTLWFSGANPNTYAGLTTVTGGTLRLQKSPGVNAVPGDLIVGAATGDPQVLVNAAEQIPDSANVNIFGTGGLAMNGVNETIGSLTMTAGSVFNGGGAALILGGGVTTLGTTSQINSDVNLGGATRTFDIADSASANDAVVNGVISNGNLLKTNGGTLLLTGNFSNTHGTTTVLAGKLVLQKTFEGPVAAPGNVTVGDGSASATLRISQTEQIDNTATLTINSLGTVELPVHQETIGGLTMTGDAQVTGAGFLVLQGNVTTHAAASSATIAPRIDLAGGLRSFTVADGSAAADLSISNELVNGSVGKFGPGRMDIKRVRDVGSLTAIEGTVRMMDDSSDAGVSVVNSLGYSGSGKIDLRNTRLVARASVLGGFSGGSYNGTLGLIQSGRNGGTWDGGGIVTSMTDAQPATALTSLGAATAAQVGRVGQVWGGATLVASDVLVMYTYGGDANLDGKINIDDYGRIDGNVASSGSVFGWFNGDFNYDGKINIDDYGIIDGNINRQGAPFSTGDGFAGVAAVPEPSAAAVLVLSLPVLARRRRQRGRVTAGPVAAGWVAAGRVASFLTARMRAKSSSIG